MSRMATKIKDLDLATALEVDAALERAVEFISKTDKYNSAKQTATLAVTDYLLYIQGLRAV